MKRCIFYLPYQLEERSVRARMLRPKKMIEAFQDIGYEVFSVTGYAKERKQRIKELKQRIGQGEEYRFLYAEASTMPMLLTEPHHYPAHPFLDFGFFRYARKEGIPLGLFYSDIFWKFDSYGEKLPKWKRAFALWNYQKDLYAYEKYLDRFYVPSMAFFRYLRSDKLCSIGEELLPGAEDIPIARRDNAKRDFSREPLTIFYVGGLGRNYQMGELLRAVNNTQDCRMILCCREKDWETEGPNLIPYLCEKIEVIHKSAEELEPYYRQADVGSLMFQPDVYVELGRPVKSFEYLAHTLPVLVTAGTDMGRFVEESEIGWPLEYKAEAISECLREILKHPALLNEKAKNCAEIKRQNTWQCRAKQVAEGLATAIKRGSGEQ